MLRTRYSMSVTACVVAVLLSACEPVYREGRGPQRIEVEQKTIPHWVLQPPIDTMYVYGVGTDLRKDRNRAIAEGRRDIARQLHIVIRGDDSEEIADEQNSNDALTSIDHLEVPGITVVRQEETEHCLYVQVALNRAAWAAQLQARITALDQEINQVIKKHRTAPEIDPQRHPIGSAARYYQRLIPLVSEREEKVQHLSIAQPGAFVPAAPTTTGAMREELARVLNNVTVEIIAEPDLESILPQLTAACANLGLRVSPNAKAPLLRLKLTLKSTHMMIDGMERLDGTFRSVVESGNGQNLGGITISLRSSSLTATVARDRMMRKIIVRWTEYLDNDFVAYLTRL